MIIINGKFNFTHRRQEVERGEEKSLIFLPLDLKQVGF